VTGPPPVEGTRQLRAELPELLGWYDRNRRDLPWRATRDPYAILVSEMMLQQTQVLRVLPYYEAFLARFPDPPALAAAPLADVLGVWSGLGYNRRARALQDAARASPPAAGRTTPAAWRPCPASALTPPRRSLPSRGESGCRRSTRTSRG